MKAITIKQPYASLIVEGIKDIENRTWKTNYRGRILIHAGKDNLIKNLKYGDDITCLNNKQLEYITNNKHNDIINKELITGAIIGSVEIVDCVINHPSIWAEKGESIYIGEYGHNENYKPIYNWVLANPIKFNEPIPMKGKLSLWETNLEECHICGEITNCNICQRCDNYYCDECSSTYNQFTQIDYNCCELCANRNDE